MTQRLILACTLLGGVALNGCASAPPRGAGFGEVREMVADRGGHRIEWNTGSDADATAAASVREVLTRGELTADDAVAVALLNNRRLQATYEDLGVAQADLVQAGLLRNPVFNAEYKFGEGGSGNIIDLAVTQEFLDVLQIPLRRRVAAQAFEATKLRVAGAVLDLAAQVRGAFYLHQASLQAAEMRRTVAEATGLSFDFARRLREAGNITELQFARERALHEQSKIDLAAAEADVLATRERLNALMGLWGQDTQWAAAPRLPDVPAEEVDVAGVESRAVERSLELAAARAELDATADALGIRRSFAVFGGGDVELGVAAERDRGEPWTVGPAVSVPIPLFDTGAARVSGAQAELRRARQAYAATAVEVRAAARAARDRLAAARSRAEYYPKVILPLRHTIVEQTQAENNAMLVGTFDVLRAKQDEIEAGAAYVMALRDYWLARAQLEQVINGRMTSSIGEMSSPAVRPSAGGVGAGH
jgi:cobalt-zinc-cadmium efflux system outer membrane protein